MSRFIEEYEAYCATYGPPERLELMLCDLNAVLRGKWLPGNEAEKLAKGAVRLPLSTYAPNILGEEVEATGLGIVVGDPDGKIVPVPGSLHNVPWARGHVAQVQVEMQDESGGISPLSPRQKLQDVVNRFEAKGLRPVVATELEFYILRPRKTAEEAPQPPEGVPNAQNYDLKVLENSEEILTEILAASKTQGLATDTLIAEYGPGQFEVNFLHTDDPVLAADTALLFRRLVKGVVRKHGMEATFMAKPYAACPGNGMHVHASVLDQDGQNIFSAEHGVSETLRAAVGGVLATMREMQAIFAPHMNSYRRFQPNGFAPTAPDWGLDNRSASVRLPETRGPGARLEHRIAGADVNPYLALTAVLGGMLHGIETRPDVPLPLEDPAMIAAAPLGHDWRQAVDLFAASEFAAELFGEDYRRIYSTVRYDEIDQLTRIISPTEYRYYLGRL
jgi:glutamine synthetase